MTMSDLVFGGVVALFFVIIILGIGMAVTSEPVRLNQQFTDERMLVKICNDGTRVYLWREGYYIEGSIPRRIGVPPEELCK